MRLAAVALAFVALIGCDEPPILVPREDAIPAGAVKMTPAMDSWPPILHSDEWESPVPMPGPINTAGAEDSPFITPDGEWFFCWFTPDVRVPAGEQLLDGATGIYWSRRVGDEWTEPERVLLSNDLALDGAHFILGDTMWFASARAGNYRELDYYTAVLRDGRWTDVRNAGPQLNREYAIGEMHVSADGRTVFCHREASRGGHGRLDLWSLSRNPDGWDPPQNLGPVINTAADEGWPFLSEDGAQLWFTRANYEGQATPGPSVWRSLLDTTGAWGPPELILSQFAGEPTLDREDNLYFVHHYFTGTDPIRMIEADIYVCCRKR
ncbi:MAG: hypothetical protein R6X12_04045 [bacterium]